MTPPADRVVRLFVSSTFRDMEGERKTLAASAFQRLRHRCEQRGVVWSEVDLRWGITDEQRLDDQVLPICLSDIDRCRPYFIAMLGERYGWECTTVPPALVARYPWLSGREGTSITELELLHGALNDPLAARAFVYLRAPDFVQTVPSIDRASYLEGPSPDEVRDLGTDDANDRATARVGKLAALKSRVRQSGLRVVDGYPDAAALDALVLDDLSRAIDEDFPETEQESFAQRETRIHENFADTRAHDYIERVSDVRALDTHADDEGASPTLAVTGEAGIGKTSLLVHWTARRRAHRDSTTVAYYVGASAESTNWRHLVMSVAARLDYPLPPDAEAPEALRVAFANALHRAAADRRVVLVFDALNQLDDVEGALDLAWLPATLPPMLRVILSAVDGRIVDECRRRGWTTFEVRPLEQQERAQLVTTYLRERYAKTLTAAQQQRITADPLCANPLWLTALLEELRLYGDHGTLDARITHYLTARSIPALFELVLARWEADYDRDHPGLVADAMRALWASRHGLSEIEVREIVGGAAGALPALSWSVFQFAADRSLVSRSGLLGFFHDYLRQAVYARYVRSPEAERAAHTKVARYFDAQPQTPRRTDELPWQLFRAEAWDKLARLLSDVGFFHEVWERDPLDVKTYWAGLEARGGMRRIDGYRAVIESPTAYVRDADAVASLLDEAGHLKEARSIYERLAAWFEQHPNALERARALTKLARIDDVSGHRSDALAALDAAEGAFRDAADEQGLIVMLGQRAQIYTRMGSPDRARAPLDEAIGLAMQSGDQQNHQALLVSQAEILIEQDEFAEAERRLRGAEHICLKLAERDALQRVYGYLSRLRHDQHRFDESLQFSNLKEAICLELGDQSGYASALNTRAVMLSEHNQLDEALRVLDTAAEIYRRIDNPSGLASTAGNRGSVKHKKGDLREALALFEQQEALYREHDELADLDTCLFNQALLKVTTGEDERALELLGDAAASAERVGHRALRATIRIHTAQLLTEQKDYARAFQELKDSARELEAIGNTWERSRAFRFMSDTLLAADRPQDALAAAAVAEKLATEIGSAPAQANALDARANVWTREGDLETALMVRKKELDLRRNLGDDEAMLATANDVIRLAPKVGDVDTLMMAIDAQSDALIRLGRREELVAQLEQTVATMRARNDVDADERRYLEHLQQALDRIRATGEGAENPRSKADSAGTIDADRGGAETSGASMSRLGKLCSTPIRML